MFQTTKQSICSMVLVYLPTWLGVFVRANVGMHIPAPWFAYGITKKTWTWLKNYILLVGGLEHEFYDFPYIGNNNPNWRTPSFFRGVGIPPTSIYCVYKMCFSLEDLLHTDFELMFDWKINVDWKFPWFWQNWALNNMFYPVDRRLWYPVLRILSPLTLCQKARWVFLGTKRWKHRRIQPSPARRGHSLVA